MPPAAPVLAPRARRRSSRGGRRIRSSIVVALALSGLGVLSACVPSPFSAGARDDPPAGPDAASALPVEPPPASVDGSGVLAALAAGDDELEADDPVQVSLLADPGWIASTAASSGVPERALAAYAGVELRMRAEQPSCNLGWSTLAGIGEVETVHGEIFGGEIGPDGITTEKVFGVSLDGTRFDAVPDSDGGAIDEDDAFDRAVGPMQIIPGTWMGWASDGGGGYNIHDIDDASLTAARYLCYSNDDLATEDGWLAAIARYNSAPSYAVRVADAANTSAARAGALG